MNNSVELDQRIEAEIRDSLNNLWHEFDIGRDDLFEDKPEWEGIRVRMRDLIRVAYLRQHSLGEGAPA